MFAIRSTIANADLLIADGTYLFQEIFPDKSEQKKLKTDPDHLHGKQILNFAGSVGAKHIVFHSITHLTEKTHAELRKMMPPLMEPAYDGIQFNLD